MTNISLKMQTQIEQEAKANFPIPVVFADQPSCMNKREGYNAGASVYAEKWQEEKELRERYEKEHADLNLALAAMLNGYQNLSMYQKDWFTVPKDLINTYTKMVLEYDANNPPLMTPNDKLPEETYNKVLGDAVAYDKERKMQVAYYDGATAWAGWKVRFDELNATIDDKIDKALHAERNKMQAMVTKMDMDWLQRAQGLADALEWIRVYGNVGELTIKFIDKALQQFKDGREVEDGIH